MGKKAEEKAVVKRNWFQELKLEFKKIIWPDKNSLVKESVAVIIIAIILGCIIAAVDYGLQFGLSELTDLVKSIG